MAFVLKPFVRAAMAAALTTGYTHNSNDGRAGIKEIECVNGSSDWVQVWVYLVPNGGTAGVSNAVFNGAWVPPTKKGQPGNLKWNGLKIIDENDATIQYKAQPGGVCGLFVDGALKT